MGLVGLRRSWRVEGKLPRALPCLAEEGPRLVSGGGYQSCIYFAALGLVVTSGVSCSWKPLEMTGLKAGVVPDETCACGTSFRGCFRGSSSTVAIGRESALGEGGEEIRRNPLNLELDEVGFSLARARRPLWVESHVPVAADLGARVAVFCHPDGFAVSQQAEPSRSNATVRAVAPR